MRRKYSDYSIRYQNTIFISHYSAKKNTIVMEITTVPLNKAEVVIVAPDKLMLILHKILTPLPKTSNRLILLSYPWHVVRLPSPWPVHAIHLIRRGMNLKGGMKWNIVKIRSRAKKSLFLAKKKKKKKIEGCQRVKLLNTCVKIKVMQCLESFTT